MKCVPDKLHRINLENDKCRAYLKKAGKGRARD